jgi:hypothetical protein
MWIPKDNNNDPYNRNNPTPTIGSGAGGGSAPLGAGEGNQTNGNPSTTNPINQIPQQKPATVQDYLGANKAQGNQLGQQFKDKLQTKAVDDKSAIDTSASAVKQQAANNTIGYDSGLVGNAAKDPTKVANDPGQLQSFLKQWNASYSGPTSFESTTNYDTAAKAANDAHTKGEQIKDAGGRKQILQDEFGVYGQGNKGLDHTLLQNSDDFGGVLDLGKNFSTIPDYFASQAKDVNAATQKAADTTNATKQNTQGMFADSMTNFQKDINGKVATDQQAAQKLVNDNKGILASGDANQVEKFLSTSNLSESGKNDVREYLTRLNGTYGVKPDLTNYYQFNPATDVSASTAASKDDYAKAQALQKLTGADYSGILNPNDVSKADTWNKGTGKVDTVNLVNYLKGSAGQQDKELVGKNTIADAGSKLGLGDLSKKPGDVQSWTKLAQSVLDAASRSKTQAGFGQSGRGATTNALGALIESIQTQYVNAANSGGGPNNPAIAGLKAANDLVTKWAANPNNRTIS